MRPTFTIVPALLLALLALLAPAPRSAAAATFGFSGFIRDVRPTTLGPDDTLILECPGIAADQPARVTLTGRRANGQRGLSWSGVGRGSTGDRVLVNLARAQPERLVRVEIEVQQDDRVWRLRPGHEINLDLAPASLEGIAHQLNAWLGSGPEQAPFVGFGLLFVIALGVHLLVAPITGLVVVWERKIWARMQSRIGPNRVGPSGWLQWLADGVKMLLKEDIVPTDADAGLFRFAPYVMWMGVFAAFVILPLSAQAIIADMNVGLLFLTSVTSLTVIGILLGGWTSNSKWSLLGGMRSAAQIVSYELPASVALLQIALLAGSLSPQAIVRAQGGLPQQWFVFANPFAFAAFFIYFIAALAEGNRTPFDLPEAESELVAGFTTEYSGFRYGVFMLAEWTNVYVLSAAAAALFLGGWNVPFVSAEAVANSTLLGFVGAAVMITKVVVMVFVIIWIRATLPRFRLDQLMSLCWKYLIPLSFAAFVLSAAWMWLVHAVPAAGVVVRWGTFLLGGVAVLGLFIARVLANFRGSRLLDQPRFFAKVLAMTVETPHTRALATRRSGYWQSIWRSARSILEGMSITFSYLWKRPITVQYPEVARPLNQTLPERYRGFLEVDMATCTGCKACERDCPIDCIAIDLVKVGDVRAMTRFDIDMGKCMYCNICVESCPVPNIAPGDAEQTKCIRMTREFEGATDSFPELTFRFVRPGDAVIPYKHKRGEVPATPQRGQIARQVREHAGEFNQLAARWALAARAVDESEAAINAPAAVQARVVQLHPQVQAAGDDPRKLEDLLYAEALAQTDCESCGYPSCRDYARGLLAGDPDSGKCEPGGGRARRDVELIFQIRRGKWAPDGARQGGDD